jgi:hypothetical protein
MIGRALYGLAFTHLFVQVPMMIGFHYAAELIGMAMLGPFPPLYVLVLVLARLDARVRPP